jgi:nitric oxide reductase NorD protein
VEEWVGGIWHRFITGKASENFEQARVNFTEVSKSVGMIFRALGGAPVKRIEAASGRDYITRKSWLEKLSGNSNQMSLCWQDEESLRLPESIAIFPTKALNRDLYHWLAMLASEQKSQFSHWAKDNQQLVCQVLKKYPGFTTRYNKLAHASIAVRAKHAAKKPEEETLENAICQALLVPGSVTEFPRVNFAPQPVYLWLYPASIAGQTVAAVAPDFNEQQETAQKSQQQTAKKARKKAERSESPEGKDGMMIFRLESLFSWSEFAKLDRSCNDEDDEDSSRVADDLEQINIGQQQEQTSANIKLDLDLPSASEDDFPLGEGIKLPEYDYRKNTLVADRCLLQPMLPRGAEPLPLPGHLLKTANSIRAQLEKLQSLRYWLKGQSQGDELDLDAWLDFHIESRLGAIAEPGLYKSFRGHHRDLSCLLLADLSMSTEAYLDDEHRVIDVVKDSLLLFGEALAAVGDRFAMYGFSSVKRSNVRFTLLKNFNESYNNEIRGRIQALRPGFYTRMGAAIRQATKVLEEQESTQKLLLIVTDGKPNDIDFYEGRYGIEDTKQAIVEAKRKGLRPFCITVDSEAQDYLPYLFGSDGFATILNPVQLPKRLPQLYHQLTT